MFFRFFIWLALLAPNFTHGKTPRDCSIGYSQIHPEEGGSGNEVEIAVGEFNSITTDLTKTLSGNLATVLRSEWKAKGRIRDANAYLGDLARQFLTPETRAAVTAGLHQRADNFIPKLAERLYALEREKKFLPGDKLFVRDPPARAGADDSTFTYYAKALRDSEGGKHQLRVRNYIRLLSLRKIKEGDSVEGIARDGGGVRIERQGTAYLVTTSGKGKESRAVMSEQEIIKIYGSPVFLFAPHGKKFKMEIKTRLKDDIEGALYPKLAGKNFVQKLDVGLSGEQMDKLFGNSVLAPAERIHEVKSELLAEPGTDAARINAVFHVLEVASREDPDYLRLEGATRYSRNAFEIAVPDLVSGKTVRLQTTVDRGLIAYQNLYRADGSLRTPQEVAAEAKIILPVEAAEEAHWELKSPKPLVRSAAGAKNYVGGEDPAQVETEDPPPSAELRAALAEFSLCEVTNRGKFLHICRQRPLLDRKQF